MSLVGRDNKLISIICFLLATFATSLICFDLAQGLRAPKITNDNTYYYVSDDVPDNGGFPDTYVGFYWNSDSGSRTIEYSPKRCNDGGYEDNTDGDPRVIIYGIHSDGSIDSGNVIIDWTKIDECHDNDSNKKFIFDLSRTSRDANIDMKGVVVRVESRGDGRSRAWFTLETSDIDGASFGAMGGYPVGYSRDFSSGDGGGYYNLETGFGSCDAAGGSGTVDIFDADTKKYQSSKPLRIQFYNNNTGSYVSSGNPPISNKSNVAIVDSTTLKATGQSSSDSTLTIQMAAKTGYRMNLNDLREGNDITVTVPTNEIYSKKICRAKWSIGASTSINRNTASVGDNIVWTHKVNNSGPDSTDRGVSYGYNHSDGWSGSVARGDAGAGQGAGDIATYTESYTIQQSDVGKTFCSQAYANPASSTNNTNAYADNECVTVPDWNLTALTYSSVNPTNPMDNSQYNNSRKSAYPNYAAFGGHSAKGTDDKIYYTVRIQRGNDGSSSPALFKYRPSWVYGVGMIGANSVNGGTVDVSASCPILGFFYQPTARRCDKNSPSFVDANLGNNSSAYYTSTESQRQWNNSLPVPISDLGKLKGMDICYFLSINRQRLSQAGNDSIGRYWGSLDGATENRCSVTVRSPWILEPKINNIPTDSAVGDTYNVTPSVASSETTVEGTIHNVDVIRVIGASTWVPTQGLNTMGNQSPSLGIFGSGAESLSVVQSTSNLTDSNFATKTWTGSPLNEEFQEAWYGKNVCYYTIIRSGGWAHDKAGEVRYSNPVCTKWSKSPQVQIRGSDAYSGGTWTNSNSTTTAFDGGFLGSDQSKPWRGSWSQYGLFSYKGSIDGFGSSGYTVSNGSDMTKACSLIFANTIGGSNCPGSAGRFFAGSSLDRQISLPKEAYMSIATIESKVASGDGIKELPPSAVNGIHINLNNLDSGTYLVDHGSSSNPTMRIGKHNDDNTQVVGEGKHIILIVPRTLIISDNIVAGDGTFSSLSDIPSLTVIAAGIEVDLDQKNSNKVSQLFGTFIARGTNSTEFFSSAVGNPNGVDVPSENTEAKRLRDGGLYNSQLRVNGAVITRNSPRLLRTMGASRTTTSITVNGETNSDSVTAAEMFNYQPNLFLTPYALRTDTSSGDATWVTSSQTVLPARF